MFYTRFFLSYMLRTHSIFLFRIEKKNMTRRAREKSLMAGDDGTGARARVTAMEWARVYWSGVLRISYTRRTIRVNWRACYDYHNNNDNNSYLREHLGRYFTLINASEEP